MKHTRMILTALMAAALALAVLAGCSSVLAGTVHEDTEQAAALMKEIDAGLAYSTELEAAARMAGGRTRTAGHPVRAACPQGGADSGLRQHDGYEPE